MTFQELGVSEAILRALETLGFTEPTPVQAKVIPYLLGIGNDVMAIAQTGTGKTAAYGVPVIQKTDVSNRATQAVVICPTRELCLQITDDLKSFARYVEGLNIVPVYGGASIEVQIKALSRGAQIIVATPGRLIDLMERGAARLDEVVNLVLDEADEMLNMGFSESIDAILSGVPKERNTLLFSATMSREIEKIARTYLHNPQEIVVGTRNEGAEMVNHEYYVVRAKDKYLALKRIVDYYPRIYAIVFCRTRIETQEVADNLIRDGYNAEALHGDLSQAQRDLTMQKFRRRRTQLLVATDVAARGLDVENLTHVINYGLPDDVENYTHRSGRTGRAGNRGTSISIIHLREKGKVRNIEKTIGKKFVLKTLPTPKEICTKQLYRVIDQLENAQVDEEQIGPFLPEVYRKLEWLDKEELIKRFVSLQFGKFLEYYAMAPDIEQPTSEEGKKRSDSFQKDSEKKQKRSESRRAGSQEPERGYVRFFFGAGKRDHFYAREIIGLINRYTLEPVDIGRIDLKTNYSYFEVPEKDADIVEGALRNAKDREGRRIAVERADQVDTGRRKSGRKSEKKEKDADRKKRKAAHTGQRGEAVGTGRKRNGKKRKDDWHRFFDKQGDNFVLKGEEPDFSEEGWAKPLKKKRKKQWP